MKNISPTQRAKIQITLFWQYEEDKKRLKELLEEVRELRFKIKKFEIENSPKKN